MWDEEINKKIKDAADQYHPAYDDTAWNKMELLLDEHLPVKKDRRRIIYFLPLIVLFLGAGIFFVISGKGPASPSEITEKSPAKNKPGKSTELTANPVETSKNFVKIVDEGTRLTKETSVKSVNPGTENADKLSARRNVSIVNKNNQSTSKNLLPGDVTKEGADISSSINANAKGNPGKNNSDGTVNPVQKPSNEETAPPGTADNNNQINKDNTPVIKENTTITKENKETVKSKDVAKAENPKKDANSKINQKKTKKSLLQNFGIGLSLGPDVSAVKLNNTGKITLTYGAELSYSFTNKFTLRTGFFVSNKIYSVDENEYHVPTGSTWNNDLQSVHADCKVYEIPLTVSYDFGKTKNHNWFASAGLSSYFMKRESYVYYYKDLSGNTWDKPWTVTNQNKHYFSVLDISAGYQYSINKQFSILAEPYVKLPLSGIGLGKIKLNSTGVLFTVAVKPFLK
jgi:Outer membrane protein beta-barrel domain